MKSRAYPPSFYRHPTPAPHFYKKTLIPTSMIFQKFKYEFHMDGALISVASTSIAPMS